MNFLLSFLASILAVVVALYIEKRRLPNISLKAGNPFNSDNTYTANHPHASERWKFFRVEVTNNKFPHIMSWIPRQTAENCFAEIVFKKVGMASESFSIKGRWANTPEPPQLGDSWIEKMYYPQSVNIPSGTSEILDVFAKPKGEAGAYGWNNEAYFSNYNWKNPNCHLTEGLYDVKIRLHTQNGTVSEYIFKARINEEIEKTTLY